MDEPVNNVALPSASTQLSHKLLMCIAPGVEKKSGNTGKEQIQQEG